MNYIDYQRIIMTIYQTQHLYLGFLYWHTRSREATTSDVVTKQMYKVMTTTGHAEAVTTA